MVEVGVKIEGYVCLRNGYIELLVELKIPNSSQNAHLIQNLVSHSEFNFGVTGQESFEFGVEVVARISTSSWIFNSKFKLQLRLVSAWWATISAKDTIRIDFHTWDPAALI